VAATLGEGESRYVSAAVALRDGVTLDAQAVRQWCIERLPPIAVPREIVQRADLPRTATGKIDGRRVREELVELFEAERAGS
jgi:acyl-coenzyme A synthetase/AMP-(fatty) acid ligase